VYCEGRPSDYIHVELLTLLHLVQEMAEFEGAVLIGFEVREYPRIDLVQPEVSSL
jgi:hypothetical protein